MLVRKGKAENFETAEINIGAYHEFQRAISAKPTLHTSTTLMIKAIGHIAALAKTTFNNKRITLDPIAMYHPLKILFEHIGWIGLHLQGPQFSYAGYELRANEENFGYIYEANPSLFKCVDLVLILAGQAGPLADLLVPEYETRCKSPQYFDQLARLWTYMKYMAILHHVEMYDILKDILTPYYADHKEAFDQLAQKFCEDLEV